ncbi:NUDIX domain-containing protein [Planctomycetota bacterium]
MAERGQYLYEWPRPMVTVDALVFCTFPEGHKVLLIKRARAPYQGSWAVPGGFLELDEELPQGAARELHEETGLSGVKLIQFRTFGQMGRDPRGRLITIVYVGMVPPANATVQAGDDAAEANWFPVDDLPSPMAFDHAQIVPDAWDYIQCHLAPAQ